MALPPREMPDVDQTSDSLAVTPQSGSDPYRAINSTNIHAIARHLFDTHFEPSQLENGIPENVDPYIYDYALSLYLAPEDYQKMQRNVGTKYLYNRSDLDSYLQKALRTDTASSIAHMTLTSAVTSLGDVALTPVNSAIARAGHYLGVCSRDQDSAIGCSLDVLANSLYMSRASYQGLLTNELPLSAWLTNSSRAAEIIRRFPYYKAMRERVYDEAVPLDDTRLRWPANNGDKSRKLKPKWVVDLQDRRQKDRQRDDPMGPLFG